MRLLFFDVFRHCTFNSCVAHLTVMMLLTSTKVLPVKNIPKIRRREHMVTRIITISLI